MRIALFALNLLAVSAFTVQPSHRPLSTALSMSAAVEEVPITVTGNNIDLTPPLVDYVNQKLERPLGKLRANGIIQDCAVHLIVNKNPKVSQLMATRTTSVLIDVSGTCQIPVSLVEPTGVNLEILYCQDLSFF